MWNYLDIICFGTSLIANFCWILNLAPDPKEQFSSNYDGAGGVGGSTVNEGEGVNFKRINNILNA